MKKILHLQPIDYYTQRNNPTKPWAACMPTSRVMFYLGNNIIFKNPSDLEDDEFFMKVLSSDDAEIMARSKYPSLALNGIPAYEIHGMYHSYLDSYVVGCRVSDFKTDLTFDDFIDRIKAGECIMTSGRFPEAGIDGHAFVVVGMLETAIETCLILADPWGDYRTEYKNHQGYGVTMSKADFSKHVKPGSQKWGHVLL